MGADTVTQGYPAPNQVIGPQGLILDRVNNLLYTFGQGGVAALVQSALKTLGIQTALTAITTAQNLLSYAFGAGALNVVGRTFTVSGSALYATTSANVATLTIALKLGSVTIATLTTAATNTAASTNLPIQFAFTVTTTSTGATGTLYASGGAKVDLGTAASAAITEYLINNTAASSAVNLTAAQTLTVTIAASAAVPSAQLMSATITAVA